MRPCGVWDTFLRIPDPATSDEVPVAEDGWLDAKGVSPAAPAILRLLQREVVPLIRRLENRSMRQISGYFFLIHNRESGVPTTADDRSAYIHMRLYFCGVRSRAAVQKLLGGEWVMTRAIYDEGTSIAGIDPKFIRGGSVDAIREILKKQSELALQIVRTYTDDVDPLALIGQVRQCLHYLSNMLQMRVS